MLQRAAEEVEYYSLIDEAVRAKDAITRIAYVAALAISGYAHTRYRTGRKGLYVISMSESCVSNQFWKVTLC